MEKAWLREGAPPFSTSCSIPENSPFLLAAQPEGRADAVGKGSEESEAQSYLGQPAWWAPSLFPFDGTEVEAQ